MLHKRCTTCEVRHLSEVCSGVSGAYFSAGFDSAKEAYECLFELDPYRIEGTDIYSNVLYVLGENTELALLAQRTALHSPNAAETHCIQGNLFSSEGRHAAAVAAFKRALGAKRDCESAWTLMGHEHIELRDTDEAVKCYRNAVDINPRDYRAWYGLAQAYELLGLQQYAAFYFHKAASLRPGDPRMWCALGMVYQNSGQDPIAATCYRRAHECNDREGLATIRLAQLARNEADYEQAEKYYAEHVRQRDNLGVRISIFANLRLSVFRVPLQNNVTPEVAEAITFLCELALQRSELDAAEQLAKRVLELPFPQEAQVASAYMRDILAARRGLGQAAGVHAASLAEALKEDDSAMEDSDMQSASELGLTGDSGDLDLTQGARKAFAGPLPSAVSAAAGAASLANESNMSSIGFSATQSHILAGNSTLPSLPGTVRRSSMGGHRRLRESGGAARVSPTTGSSPGQVSLGALDVSGVMSPGNDSMMSSSTLSSHRSERGRGL